MTVSDVVDRGIIEHQAVFESGVRSVPDLDSHGHENSDCPLKQAVGITRNHS